MNTFDTCIYLLDTRNINADHFLNYLNPQEMERYLRFIRIERQRQFVLGRALLRQSIAKTLNLMPDILRFSEQKNNVPLLEYPIYPNLFFSISHSRYWVACAISTIAKIGVDIEFLDPNRDIAALIEHIFDAENSQLLEQLPEAQKVQAFYQLWSIKEARFKLNTKTFHDYKIPHAELAITLCTDKPLSSNPEFITFTLAP
jgi:4'-phosphopantetheinyl transferase